MSLAIFDLDNTLLAGDSDYLWGKFLSDKHIVDAQWYETENQRFYDAYKEGTLNIYEFLAFSLHFGGPEGGGVTMLTSFDPDDALWFDEFMASMRILLACPVHDRTERN